MYASMYIQIMVRCSTLYTVAWVYGLWSVGARVGAEVVLYLSFVQDKRYLYSVHNREHCWFFLSHLGAERLIFPSQQSFNAKLSWFSTLNSDSCCSGWSGIALVLWQILAVAHIISSYSLSYPILILVSWQSLQLYFALCFTGYSLIPKLLRFFFLWVHLASYIQVLKTWLVKNTVERAVVQASPWSASVQCWPLDSCPSTDEQIDEVLMTFHPVINFTLQLALGLFYF